jgi:hypothetical protein
VVTRAEIAREMKRRARARESFPSFLMNVQIPTVPGEPMCPDEDLLGPAEQFLTAHHRVIAQAIQRTILKPMGRLIIMAPPGSAKSLYAVSGVCWAMGKFPGHRFIYASYADDLANTQSSRAQFLVEQKAYRDLWAANPILTKKAVTQWKLSNESEFLAAGLMSGVTGHRANGWLIDDPVKGRREADSETTRQTIYNAYKDDLLTRCLPNAWGIIILTRWHEDDIVGRILPPDYEGESGVMRGTDGLEWEVLNIPAKCERPDDPLGRQIGEYIWPEFYPPEHWAMFEKAQGSEAARTWSSLYQQRPTPQGAGRFHESMFHFYNEGEQPPYMVYVMAGDYAVTENGGDFSELGVFGVDTRGELWEVDWWSKQANTNTSANATLDMAAKWKCSMHFNEGGVIDKAMSSLFNILRNQRVQDGKPVYVDIRALPNMHDKVAKCASFQGRAASGGEKMDGSGTFNHGSVHFRNNANSRRVVNQLVALPAGRYDDAADVCGLIGRGMDQFPIAMLPHTPERRPALVPFSVAWLESREEGDERKVRWR